MNTYGMVRGHICWLLQYNILIRDIHAAVVDSL